MSLLIRYLLYPVSEMQVKGIIEKPTTRSLSIVCALEVLWACHVDIELGELGSGVNFKPATHEQ